MPELRIGLMSELAMARSQQKQPTASLAVSISIRIGDLV